MNPIGIQLYELAGRLARLDPESFDVERVKLAAEMRQIARQVELASDAWRPREEQGM